VTVHKSDSFTPLSTLQRWNSPNQRTFVSRSRLFDSEESTLWTPQEWTTANDFTTSLNKPENPWDVSSNDFVPSEADLQAAEKALEMTKASMRENDSSSIWANLEGEFGDKKKKVTASVRETGTDSMKNYIKTMCNHELLNKNEEIILAREIQILLVWEKQREELELQLLR
jgi:hypothetical protein